MKALLLLKSSFLSEVLPPALAGAVIGSLNWVLPLTAGNGNLVFGYLIKFGAGFQVRECARLLLVVALGVAGHLLESCLG